MPKLSRDERRKRRQDILDYIRMNQPVSSFEIREAFGINRSSLSDDVRAINSQSIVIVQPKKGVYEINPQNDTFAVGDFIDKDYIRKWIILYTLSLNKDELKFDELYDEIRNKRRFPCYPDTIRRDLKELIDAGLVTRRIEGRSRLFSSCFICNPDPVDVKMFIKRSKGFNPRIEIEANENIVKQLMRVCPDVVLKEIPDENTILAGKFNLLSDAYAGLLERFECLPYRSYALDVVFMTKANVAQRICFYTGMVVYSVEIGRLYLFGKNADLENVIIPLDRVDFEKIGVAMRSKEKIVNVYYQSSEFIDIRRQMFNISVEEPQYVRIRFENVPFIKDRVYNLARMREDAETEIVNDDTEILYTDTIRGLHDLARYLRQFGGRAIVEKPKDLRELLIETSKKTLALYDG